MTNSQVEIPLTIASNNMKCVRINLAKYKQNVCSENYKALVKEIKEDLNKWRNVHFIDWKIQ